jgi:hypothetical protein
MENAAGTTEIISTADVSMNWGAIFGGWLIATAMACLMYLGGLAAGFTGFGLHVASTGMAAGTAVWLILTCAVPLFLGGLFASWFDGKADQTVGTMHGITVWGLAVTVSSFMSMHRMMHAAEASAAAHPSQMAMGMLCLSIFIALVAAAVGGWLGAGHIHKVHHLRHYPKSPVARP